jgi:putative tricarboxylic transport membrane protein
LVLKKGDLILSIVWLVLGIAIVIASCHLGLGSFARPGDGLMSFGVGILLSLCAIPVLIRSFVNGKNVRHKEEEEGIWSGVDFKKIAFVLASLVLYSLLLERLGFLVTTFLMLLVLFKAVGSQRWTWAVIAAFLTVSLTYVLFVVLLDVYMPSLPLGIG